MANVFVISARDLRRRVYEVFCATGCPEAASRRVAESLVESNLTGHDSHGVIRVPSYVRAVQSGRIQPRGEIRVARESATTAVLDCGHNPMIELLEKVLASYDLSAPFRSTNVAYNTGMYGLPRPPN